MSKKVCRLCLGLASVAHSLLENQLNEMLESLTSIKVTVNDAVSTNSCTKCMLNMKLAFNIQQNFLIADKKLRESAAEIKQEEILETVMDDSDLIINDCKEFVRLCNFSCVICGQTVDDLAKHVQEHFTAKQYCEACTEHFTNIDAYRKHMLAEHNEKQQDYVCKKCGVKFRYKSLYNIHETQAHSTTTMLSSSSVTAELLKATLKESLKDQNSYRCDTCFKSFKTKRQFSVHSHDRKKCPICSAYITRSNIRKHILNHSSGPQICELCGATLRSLESLRGHLAHTHSKACYKCEQCNKTFNKKYNYLLHMKKHSGEKTHICETCGKSFLTFFYLNKHIKSAHLKMRPHICEYCKRGFSSRFALKTHVRQHTNETPYRCEVCGEGFRQNVSLRSHRKSKHNIVEPKTCACKVCGKEFSCEQAIISHMRLH